MESWRGVAFELYLEGFGRADRRLWKHLGETEGRLANTDKNNVSVANNRTGPCCRVQKLAYGLMEKPT